MLILLSFTHKSASCLLLLLLKQEENTSSFTGEEFEYIHFFRGFTSVGLQMFLKTPHIKLGRCFLRCQKFPD